MVFLGRFLVYSYLVFAIFLPADAETERQRATSVNLSLSPSHSLPLASSTYLALTPLYGAIRKPLAKPTLPHTIRPSLSSRPPHGHTNAETNPVPDTPFHLAAPVSGTFWVMCPSCPGSGAQRRPSRRQAGGGGRGFGGDGDGDGGGAGSLFGISGKLVKAAHY